MNGDDLRRELVALREENQRLRRRLGIDDDRAIGRWWLGFDSAWGRLLAGRDDDLLPGGVVPPRSTVIIASRPQVPFRGERLYTWGRCAASFMIHEFRVGNASQMATVSSIPADAFATRMDRLAEIDRAFVRDEAIRISVEKGAGDLLGAPWDLPIVMPGTEIFLVVENVDDRPLRFVAGMVGGDR